MKLCLALSVFSTNLIKSDLAIRRIDSLRSILHNQVTSEYLVNHIIIYFERRLDTIIQAVGDNYINNSYLLANYAYYVFQMRAFYKLMS